MSKILKDLKTVEFKQLKLDRWVLDTAMEVQNSVLKKGTDERKPEVVLMNAIGGLALELAVFQKLKALESIYQFKVSQSTEKEYDIKIQLSNGDNVLIDVKGLFGDSKGDWVTQSLWESKNADLDTVYLVFDCRSGSGKFIGWCNGFDFTPSKFEKSGPYIATSKLWNDDTFV